MTHLLRELLAFIWYTKQRVSEVRIERPNAVQPFCLEVCVDASPGSKNCMIPRGGYIILGCAGDVAYPIQWSSRRLKIFFRGFSTAEIISASESADVGIYYREILNEMLYANELYLFTDYISLLVLVSPTKEPE